MTLPAVGASVWASGKPGVNGKHGHLDRKGEGEGRKEPVLLDHRNFRFVKLENVEGIDPGFAAVMEVEGHDRHEHQDASHHREKEELDGRIDPVRAAPYPDEEVHGDQHELPEDVEQNEVQGAQGADHRRFQQEEGDVIFLDLVLDRFPGAQDAKDGDEGGEHHQEHADAVDAEEIADPPFRVPLPLLDELHRGGLFVELKEQRERQDKFQQRPDQDGRP